VVDLQRFVDAQDSGGTYAAALAELRSGRKRSHWMWFVFPQLAGLGRSAMAQRYALSGLQEARDYLAHPVLGPRLRACAQALLDLPVPDAEQVLGPVDGMKLRSSMTLFALAAPGEPAFRDVLTAYFSGEVDEATSSRVAARSRPPTIDG
jgi:uncharacterized protein (DUF1810 family)